MHTSPTDRDFFLELIYIFPVHSPLAPFFLLFFLPNIAQTPVLVLARRIKWSPCSSQTIDVGYRAERLRNINRPQDVLMCIMIEIYLWFIECNGLSRRVKILCCINFYVKYFNRGMYSAKYEVCCNNIYVNSSTRELS